jgi:hypothetical protein
MSDHTKFLHPKLHNHRDGERLYFKDMKGKLAIVYNWQDSGKWKVLPDLDMPIRRAFEYTKKLFDSFEDAARVYDMLCSTSGLTKAA